MEIPAYEAMNNGMGSRLLEILMHHVSTRNYRLVIQHCPVMLFQI